MSASSGFSLLAEELASAQKTITGMRLLSRSDVILYTQLLGTTSPEIQAEAPLVPNQYEALALLLKHENARLKGDNQFFEFAQKDRETNEGRKFEELHRFNAHLENEVKQLAPLKKRHETLEHDLIDEVRRRQCIELEMERLKKRLKTVEMEIQDECTARIQKARTNAMDEIHSVWETLCIAWQRDNSQKPTVDVVEALDTIRTSVVKHLI